LGIYSGRRVDKGSVEAQLGIVWKEPTINQIINGKTAGPGLFAILQP
jgi:hypothetical protein